jgi:hypothetical protein
MVAIFIYDNETERRQHLSAIHMLSIASGIPEDDIRSLYESELSILKEHARIKDFLSVLVSRKIRGKLEQNKPAL